MLPVLALLPAEAADSGTVMFALVGLAVLTVMAGLAIYLFVLILRHIMAWNEVPYHVARMRALMEKWEAEGFNVQLGGMPPNVRKLSEVLEQWDAKGGPIDLEVLSARVEQLAKLGEKWERDGLPVAFTAPRAQQASSEEA